MKKTVVPICVILFIMFIGCYLIIMEYAKEKAAAHAAKEEELKEEEVITELPEQDEGVHAILLETDTQGRTMTLQDIVTEKIYELPYEDSLVIESLHGDIMSLAQVTPGQIFRISYSSGSRKLTGLKMSDIVWTYTDVTRFSFDERRKVMTIADDAYKFTDGLKIFSQGKQAEIMDVTQMDKLTVRGIDKQILSVTVDKGHGYLRILNDAYFVGGWIEIGQDIIKPITEDMLIPVGEGDYLVRVTNRGYAGEKNISITRDTETDMDLSKIEIEEVAIGHILFKISPDYARLYIDDEMTEFEERVPLEFGVHALRVECAGYNTIRSNIKVGSDYAEIEITMDEEESVSQDKTGSSFVTPPTDTANTASSTNDADNSGSSSTTAADVNGSSSETAQNTDTASSSSDKTESSSGSTTNVISAEKKIYVEQPAGTEIYLDGNYIGVAPVSTAKVTGTHVLTLSREGYKTRSYTVNIANDGNDVTFSFSELTK